MKADAGWSGFSEQAVGLTLLIQGRVFALVNQDRAPRTPCFDERDQEIWALDSIGWIRWFVANFATEDDVKRTDAELSSSLPVLYHDSTFFNARMRMPAGTTDSVV